MASIGHVAVGLAVARAWGPQRALTKRAALAFVALSLWPDLDAIGFAFGIDYGDQFGHRGATHSIVMSAVIALAAYSYAARHSLAPGRTAAFASLTSLSHCLLDTMTYGGGLGCALLWPFLNDRYWAPVRFIPIAPIGLRLLSARGLRVMAIETVMFLPFWLYAFWPRKKRQMEAG